jgi:hypothetical protein
MARKPHPYIKSITFTPTTSSATSDTEFKKDMDAVKAGTADASKMAEKWGQRGEAFLGFIKS